MKASSKVPAIVAVLIYLIALWQPVAKASEVQIIPLENVGESSAYIQRTGDFSSTNASGYYNQNFSVSIASYSWTNLQGYLLSSNAFVVFECSGTNAGVDHPQVTALVVQLEPPGFAPFASNLEIRPINGFVPAIGDEFNVIRYGALSGAFRTVTVPTAPPGGVWRVSYGTRGVVVGLYPISDPELTGLRPANQPGAMQFRAEAPIGNPLILESSTNMVTWTPVLTNETFTGWTEFRNTFGTNESLFYRVRSVLPTPP